MASYLSEGSEVKKLSKQLSEQKAALEEAQSKINEKETLVETARAEARAANDRIKRTETMNELLKPLSRDKKTVMEDLLKDIKTTNLKEAFSRYLPAVMNGGKVEPAKQTLAETTQPKSVAITGDRTNKLSQAVIEESKQSDNLGVILHLAGIKN